MINYILQIIGIVAIIWIAILIVANLIHYIVLKYTYNGNDWASITRDTSIYCTQSGEWYIIPTISFYLEFNNKTYPSFQIIWFKWIFNISYHFKTEKEEEIEAEVRQQFNENKQ